MLYRGARSRNSCWIMAGVPKRKDGTPKNFEVEKSTDGRRVSTLLAPSDGRYAQRVITNNEPPTSNKYAYKFLFKMLSTCGVRNRKFCCRLRNVCLFYTRQENDSVKWHNDGWLYSLKVIIRSNLFSHRSFFFSLSCAVLHVGEKTRFVFFFLKPRYRNAVESK